MALAMPALLPGHGGPRCVRGAAARLVVAAASRKAHDAREPSVDEGVRSSSSHGAELTPSTRGRATAEQRRRQRRGGGHDRALLDDTSLTLQRLALKRRDNGYAMAAAAETVLMLVGGFSTLQQRNALVFTYSVQLCANFDSCNERVLTIVWQQLAVGHSLLR